MGKQVGGRLGMWAGEKAALDGWAVSWVDDFSCFRFSPSRPLIEVITCPIGCNWLYFKLSRYRSLIIPCGSHLLSGRGKQLFLGDFHYSVTTFLELKLGTSGLQRRKCSSDSRREIGATMGWGRELGYCPSGSSTNWACSHSLEGLVG